MSTKPGPKKKKQTKKHDWSFWAIIVCLIALAIPAGMLGASAISAALASSKPIIGDRFENQYDKVIEDTQRDEIKTALSALEGVKDVKTELITGTLRVYLVVDEALDVDTYEDLMDTAYETVAKTLPIAEYFTKDEAFHRYDLELHMLNMLSPTEETRPNFHYYTLIKTALMEEPKTAFVSEPISAEFVEQLWQISNDLDKPEPEAETDLPEAIDPSEVSDETSEETE